MNKEERQVFPNFGDCVSAKYRVRRCCSVCLRWEIWRHNRVISDFPSAQLAWDYIFRPAKCYN